MGGVCRWRWATARAIPVAIDSLCFDHERRERVVEQPKQRRHVNDRVVVRLAVPARGPPASDAPPAHRLVRTMRLMVRSGLTEASSRAFAVAGAIGSLEARGEAGGRHEQKVVQIVTTTIERAKRRHLEDINQVVAAITSLTQTRFPCVFCRFDLFEETGKMLSH